MIYSFEIDEKSLFRGIKNNYKKGQSATVHTPLNQAKDEKKWRKDIYAFINGYASVDVSKLPELLIMRCLRNTTSQAAGKIAHFFVFRKFSLDGIPFSVNSSFAMYVKEEISERIIKRNGNISENTHIGRQKLHYPTSLIWFPDGYNIDNGAVLDKIMEVNGGFAYVVNGFDVDDESSTLNFRTTMVGVKGVLLSNVFRRKKGVGPKLLIDDGLFSQLGVPAKGEIKLSTEEKSTFLATLEKIQESSRVSGFTGEEYVYKNLKSILKTEAIKDLVHISKKYPQSPYDLECMVNNAKMYIEVKSTKSAKKEFYMSKGERLFMEKYFSNYILVLVTNVQSKRKSCNCYRKDDILNDKKMRQEKQSIKFIVI